MLSYGWNGDGRTVHPQDRSLTAAHLSKDALRLAGLSVCYVCWYQETARCQCFFRKLRRNSSFGAIGIVRLCVCRTSIDSFTIVNFWCRENRSYVKSIVESCWKSSCWPR